MHILFFLFLLLLVLSVGGYFLGRSAAATARTRSARPLHSLPSFHGWFVLLWCGVPSGLIYVAWIALEGPIVELLVSRSLSEEMREGNVGLVLSEVRNVAAGVKAASEASRDILVAVEHYRWLSLVAHAALWVVALVAAIAGIAYARRQISPDMRARNAVEAALKFFFMVASVIAVMTTIGIVM